MKRCNVNRTKAATSLLEWVYFSESYKDTNSVNVSLSIEVFLVTIIGRKAQKK